MGADGRRSRMAEEAQVICRLCQSRPSLPHHQSCGECLPKWDAWKRGKRELRARARKAAEERRVAAVQRGIDREIMRRAS